MLAESLSGGGVGRSPGHKEKTSAAAPEDRATSAATAPIVAIMRLPSRVTLPDWASSEQESAIGSLFYRRARDGATSVNRNLRVRTTYSDD